RSRPAAHPRRGPHALRERDHHPALLARERRVSGRDRRRGVAVAGHGDHGLDHRHRNRGGPSCHRSAARPRGLRGSPARAGSRGRGRAGDPVRLRLDDVGGVGAAVAEAGFLAAKSLCYNITQSAAGRRDMRILAFLALAAGLCGVPGGNAEPVPVVAAEDFYGEVAGPVGGAQVKVTSILPNPDQDPHLFEASASTARSLAAARIVIYNGADYDPWMTKLLSASRASGRVTVEVAKLVGKKAGDNPHL